MAVYSTALSLIQRSCYEAGIPNVPSTLLSLTNAGDLQLLNLFYATGRELRQCRCWAQLKRQHTIVLEAGRSQYPLPQDFFAALPGTHWDQQNRWQMRGPMTDAGYGLWLYGYITVENRKIYRVFGPDANANSTRGQLMVNPVPGASVAGQTITFEYMARSWLFPPNWLPSTPYNGSASPPPYVNVNGNIYQCATTGTHSSATRPPSVGAAGIGQDGGVLWMVLDVSAWTVFTTYKPYQFVTNGGNLYVCTQGGVSGATGPTGTAVTTVTDGTAAWLYCAAPSWVTGTTYGSGVFVHNGTPTYFKAVTPPNQLSGSQVSGPDTPTWVVNSTTWKESDGATTWNYILAPYESIISDGDLCLFDEELMILGLKWRFMQSRGMEFEDLRSDYELEKGRAVSRWNVGQKISLGAGGVNFALNVPEGGFG